MYKFNIEASLISPISEIPIQINFFYDGTFCYEHWLMPWETGFSKTIHFALQTLSDEFHVNGLVISDGKNNKNIYFESVKSNGDIQKLSKNPHMISSFVPQHFLPLGSLQYSVLKFLEVPTDIEISHSYLCNNHLYIPECDTGRAKIFIPYHYPDFSFKAEIFTTNVMYPKKAYICDYKHYMIESKEIPVIEHDTQNARHLVHKINSYFQETQTEKDVNITDTKTASPPAYIKETQNQLSNLLRDTTKNHFYPVIKIEGLPENALQGKVFYNNQAYYIAGHHIKNFNLVESADLGQNLTLTLSLFKEDTSIPEMVVNHKVG